MFKMKVTYLKKGKRILAGLLAALMIVLSLCGCTTGESSSKKNSGSKEKSSSEMIVGLTTGSVFDVMAKKEFPGCKIDYINATADMPIALETGKIDAYICDEPLFRIIQKEYPNHYVSKVLEKEQCGFIFPKDYKNPEVVRQLNDYIRTIREDGTMKEIDAIWFGDDESLQVVDYDSLTGENGELTLCITTDVGIPFSYVKDGKYVGYDVDMAVRFCKEYGYGLNIIDTNFAGLLASVSSGKCDFGASCVIMTPERMETMEFTEPNYNGATVLIEKEMSWENHLTPSDPSVFDSLAGKKVGVLSGAIFDTLVEEAIPDAEIIRFSSTSDLPLALDLGKIDAYVTDEPVFRILSQKYTHHNIFGVINTSDYAYIFPKGSPRADTFQLHMNEFLQKIKGDGTIDKINELWFGNDTDAQNIDFDSLTGENGTLVLSLTTGIGVPFTYVKDGKYAGYDVDIAFRFCKEYGYDLEIRDSDFSGMIAAVSSGRCDMGCGSIAITEERLENMNFSDPNYYGGVVVIEKGTAGNADDDNFGSFGKSFERTFITEGRWKLFIDGIRVTMEITIGAALFGTILGFALFLIIRKNNRIFNAAIHACRNVLEMTPVVVILMIFYYILLKDTSFSGEWVSIIGFTLIFASSVIGLLTNAVSAIDKGQMEAALALGFSDTKAFLRVILPQAMQFFLPGYRSEIVTLIKSTAIVGYIAVQDLTKISDIIRSRTYEPFLPLIASAVFYYLIAKLLSEIVKKITVNIDPKRRTAEQILKGADKK